MYATNILADSVYGGFVQVSLTFKQSADDGTDSNVYRPSSERALCVDSAHCHPGAFELRNLYVITGQHPFSETTGQQEFLPISEFTTHREYDRVTLEYDIALIKARCEFNLGSNRKPVSLHERGDFA